MSATPDPASHVRVVLVTVPDADQGRILARRIVQERLSACGNVIPGLTSVYWWDEEVQEDAEAMVIFKTTVSSLSALQARVVELHPYDVPEFLVLSVDQGNDAYLRWVLEEVEGSGKTE